MKKLTFLKKNIEKQMDKFADVVKKNKFVVRFNGGIDKNIPILDVKIEKHVKRIKISYIRISKRILGRKRLNIFLHKLLNNFCDEHNNLVWLIENRSYDGVDYESCKNKLAVIIRAKNRMNKKNITNIAICNRIIYERSNNLRFINKYELELN